MRNCDDMLGYADHETQEAFERRIARERYVVSYDFTTCNGWEKFTVIAKSVIAADQFVKDHREGRRHFDDLMERRVHANLLLHTEFSGIVEYSSEF
ncbi:MAG: hypothetical protein GY906_04945 [bacterium]|nr:hypothetical protein [bacterium]